MRRIGVEQRLYQNRELIAFLLLLSVLGISHPSGAEPQFRAEGLLDYRVFSEKGEIIYSNLVVYQVDVFGDKWKIRTSSAIKQPNRLLLYREFFHDGNDTYGFSIFDSNKVGRLKAENGKRPENVILRNLEILKTKFPPLDDSLAGAVWLAYLSPVFLRTDSIDGKLQPVFSMNQLLVESDYRMPVKITRSKDSTNYPSAILFWNDGYFPQLDERGSPISKNGRVETTAYSEPFANGFPEAEFKVLQFKSIGDDAVPQKVILELFSSYPKSMLVGRASNDLHFVAARIVGTATNIVVLTNITMQTVASTGERTLVKDRRVISDVGLLRPLTYVTTNGNLLDSNSPSYNKKLNAQKKLEAKSSAARLPSGSRRYVTIAVLLVSIFAPLVLWGWIKQQKQQ